MYVCILYIYIEINIQRHTYISEIAKTDKIKYNLNNEFLKMAGSPEEHMLKILI